MSIPNPNLPPWHYKNQKITDISQLPDGSLGFIYRIINTETRKWYVGKKNLHSTRNIKLGKRALAAREDKRSSKKKTVIKESDWKMYYGSEPELLKDIEVQGHRYFYREILCICHTKADLTYEELRHQILLGCLESDNCYNNNIAGRYFRKK